MACAAALMVAAAAAPAGAAKAAAVKPDANGALVISVPNNVPGALDPQLTNLGGAGTVQFALSYDRLVQLTPDLKLAPMLAESWKWDTTGTAVTFNLRKDVKFQDGTPFTADIAAANIKRDIQAGSNGQVTLTNLVGETAVDPNTLRLTFATVDPAIIYQFVSYAGMMASSAALANPNLMKTQSMGTGAYKITAVDADATYHLERNEAYWDKTHVYPAKVTMTAIVDETTRLNAVKTAQADITYVSSQTYPSAKADTTLNVHNYTSIAPWFLFLNNMTAPFDKPEVREAVNLAIDRKALAASQNGLFVPYGQVFSPSIAGYVPSLKPVTDLTKAKKLMSQAGVTSASVKMIVSNAEPYPTIAKVLQAQLAQIGLNVTLDIVSGSAMRPTYRLGAYAMFAGPTTGLSPDPVQPMDSGFIGPDNPGTKDPKLVDMVAKARQLPLESKERTAAFQDINKYLYTNPVEVPLAINYNVWVAAKRVIGYDNIPLANISLGPDMHLLQAAKSK